MSSVCIFEDVHNLTRNYHDNGGVAVIARNLVEAASLIPYEDYYSDPKTTGQSRNWELVTSGIFKLAEHQEPEVFVFPNAGCC